MLPKSPRAFLSAFLLSKDRSLLPLTPLGLHGRRLKCSIPPLRCWNSWDICKFISLTRTSSHLRLGFSLGYRDHRVAAWERDVTVAFLGHSFIFGMRKTWYGGELNKDSFVSLNNKSSGANLERFFMNCALLRGISVWKSVDWYIPNEMTWSNSLGSQRASLANSRFHFEYSLVLFPQAVRKLTSFIYMLKDSKLKSNGSLFMIVSDFTYGAIYQTELKPWHWDFLRSRIRWHLKTTVN